MIIAKKILSLILIIAVIYLILAVFSNWWPFAMPHMTSAVIKKNETTETYQLFGYDKEGKEIKLVDDLTKLFDGIDKTSRPALWFFNRQDQIAYVSSVTQGVQKDTNVITNIYSYDVKKDKMKKNSIP